MPAEKNHGAWYHGWNIVAVCALGEAMAIALTINCSSLFMPYWTRDFGVPVSTIAIGVMLFSLTSAVTSYFAGICVARYPARLVFGVALALLGAAHLMVAAAQHIWQVLAVYGLVLPFAIGFSGGVPCQALVSRWFTRRVGLAMGLTAAGLALPGLIFPSIIIALLHNTDWRHIWIGQGLIILLFVLPCALLVLKDRPDPGDPAGYVTPATTMAAKGEALSLGQIVGRRNFWVVMAAFLSTQFIPMSLYVNITPIIDSYGGSATLAGLFLMTFSVAAMLAKLAAGWMSDRIGNRLPLAVAALGTSAGALLLTIPQTYPGMLIVTAIAIGCSGATWTLLASSMLAEFGAASFARAFGLASALSTFSTFSAPIVAKAQEVTGSYVVPLTTLGGLATIAAIGVLVFLRPRPAPAIAQPI